LHLMNQSGGLVAHRVEVVAQSAGGQQLEPQMFEPESERDRLLQQQPGILVFVAAVETAHHQEKIDDIGTGEDREYVEATFQHLRTKGVKVFYDKDRTVELGAMIFTNTCLTYILNRQNTVSSFSPDTTLPSYGRSTS
jgi:hypothetical protein